MSMLTQTFIKLFQSVQGIRLFFLFFRIWTSATPRPIPIEILQSYILSISMRMQNFIKLFQSVQEIRLFFLFFRIWTSATPRPIPIEILQSEILMFYILSISMRMQNFIELFQTVWVIDIFRHFSRIGRGQNLDKLFGDKISTGISLAGLYFVEMDVSSY